MAAERMISRRADVIFSLVVVALGVGVIFEGSRLAPSQFDPLGAGGVPIGIGALLVFFGGWIGLAQLFGQGVGGGQRMFSGLEEDNDAGIGPLRWQRSLVVYLVTFVYLAVLSLREIEFFPATAVYMVGLLYFLGDRTLKSMLVAVPLSIAVAFALDQIFRRILMVNLP